ncbi:hypothetical protein QAD02_004318 [Eretmocerus hayati]|uniref:Uncharacterized protein n=1 Tax=Eretmocerus hayati TaxID=131215 RepID=A0ACC2NPK7_9HYME|nr:hypothetical protein QAD02_004318 [Eretmocerus hayati]
MNQLKHIMGSLPRHVPSNPVAAPSGCPASTERFLLQGGKNYLRPGYPKSVHSSSFCEGGPIKNHRAMVDAQQALLHRKPPLAMLHSRNSSIVSRQPVSTFEGSLKNFTSSTEPNAKASKKTIKTDASKSEKLQVQSSNSNASQTRSYAQMIADYSDAMCAKSVVSTLTRFERPKFGKTSNTKSPVLNESPKRNYFTRQNVKVIKDESNMKMQRDLDLVCGPGENLPPEWVSQHQQQCSPRKRKLNSINIMFDEVVSTSNGGTEKLRIVTSDDKIEIQIPISTREYQQLQQKLSKLHSGTKVQGNFSSHQAKTKVLTSDQKETKDSGEQTSKVSQSSTKQSNKLFHPTRNKVLPWWASPPKTQFEPKEAKPEKSKILASSDKPPEDSKGDGDKPKKDDGTTEEKKPVVKIRRKKKLSSIAKVKKHLEIELEEKKKEKQEQPLKKKEKENENQQKKKDTEDGGGEGPPKSARDKQSTATIKMSSDKADKPAQLTNERKREPPMLDQGDGVRSPVIRPIEKLEESTLVDYSIQLPGQKSKSRRMSLPELKKTTSTPLSRPQQPRRSGIPLKVPPSEALLRTHQKELRESLALAKPQSQGEPSGEDGNGAVSPGDSSQDHQTGTGEETKCQEEDSGEGSTLTPQRIEQIMAQRREFLGKLGLDWNTLEAKLNRPDSESSLEDRIENELVYSTYLHRFHTRRREPLIK